MTPQVVDSCGFRIISYRARTDPNTGVTTLTATWRGRYDQLESSVAALVPGSACPVAGYEALRLKGRPDVDAAVGPFRTFAADYEGWIDGDSSVDHIAPLTTFRNERREVLLNDSKGRQLKVSFDAPVAQTDWASRDLRGTPRYATRVDVKDDPVPLDFDPVDPDLDLDQVTLTVDVDYKVVTRSYWLEQRQDENAIWHNSEVAEKVIVAPKATA